MKIIMEKSLRVNAQKNDFDLVVDGTKDFGGLGESFSPTDLLCHSLTSCMMIMMAKKAADLGYDISNSNAEFNYSYTTGPKIKSIDIKFKIDGIPKEYFKDLKIEADKCPIHKAITSEIDFQYELN